MIKIFDRFYYIYFNKKREGGNEYLFQIYKNCNKKF